MSKLMETLSELAREQRRAVELQRQLDQLRGSLIPEYRVGAYVTDNIFEAKQAQLEFQVLERRDDVDNEIFVRHVTSWRVTL